MDFYDLSTRVGDLYDLTPMGAATRTESCLKLIEATENTTITRSCLSPSDADCVVTSIAATIDLDSKQALHNILNAANDPSPTTTQARPALRLAVQQAADAGVPVKEIMKASRLSRLTIYEIIS